MLDILEPLYSAIDDAHYIAALHEGKLPPSRPFPQLADRDINTFIEDLRENSPESFELDKICAEPLGFYLVSLCCDIDLVIIHYFPHCSSLSS